MVSPAPTNDEFDRVAIAAELERDAAELEEKKNFSAFAEDVQELIADQLIPELAALKKVVDEKHLGVSETHQPGFLDDDFVETREQEHVNTGNQILLVLLLLITCKLAGHLVQVVQRDLRVARYIRYVNSSTVSVFVGWLFGVALEFSESATIRATRKFSSAILYYVLIPPIILEAGYTLQKKQFFSHIFEITTLAVVGTLISTITIAWILSSLINSGLLDVLLGASGMELILFASLLSAVDPVCILSILSSNPGVTDGLLESLIFGESVFNDAVVLVLTKQISMVLSTTLLPIKSSMSKNFNKNHAEFDDFNDGDTEYDHLREYHDANMQQLGDDADFKDLAPPADLAVSQRIILSFVFILIGSVLHGVLAGLLFTKGMAKLGHSVPVVTHVLLVFLQGLVTYIVAEAFSLSGLMALFFYAIVVSHFNRYNMSAIARITLAQSLRVLASASETYLYAYLGMTLTVMHDTHSYVLSAWTLAAVLVARAISIFPLTIGLNLFNKYCRDKVCPGSVNFCTITWKHQIMLWLSGLRGALSFGLSLDFPGKRHPFFVSTTIFVVLFTVLVMGSLTEPALSYLQIGGSNRDHGGSNVTELAVTDVERTRLIDSSTVADTRSTDIKRARTRMSTPMSSVKGSTKPIQKGEVHDTAVAVSNSSSNLISDESSNRWAKNLTIIWNQIQEHLTAGNDAENLCAVLDDEELCAVVESELVTIARSHRQQHHATAKDTPNKLSKPSSKSQVV